MSSATPTVIKKLRERATPDKVGFVVMMKPFRTGGLAFLTFLEHRHFTPVPLPRDDYELAEVHWEEMVFGVCLIPAQMRPAAEQIARELGLRFADGVPHVYNGKGWQHFPIDLPNIFTVENVLNHFVYKNNPAERKTAFDYEMDAVNRTIAESVAKLKAFNEKAAPGGAAV